MKPATLSRRDFLQRASFLALGASAASALAACQPAATVSGDAAAGDAAPMPEPVELSIWTFGSFFTDFYEAIFPAYKEIAPDVTVEVQEIPGGQMFDNLVASFAAGTGAPDIADIEQGAMSRFFKGEIGLIDLTDLVAPYIDDYVMARTDPYAYLGRIFGIDHCLCPVVLYYRHDLYAEAGIEMPVATWQEFVEAAQGFEGSEAAAMSLSERSWGDYWMLLTQRGTGGIFNADGEVIIDQPEAIDTLSFYVDQLTSGTFAVTPDGPAGYAALAEGKIAGRIGADWFGGFIKLNVGDPGHGLWMAAPLPAWEEGGARTTAHGGTGYTITKQSEAPDAAWAFIEFALFDKDNKYIEYGVNNLIPPILSMLDDERYLAPDPWYSDQSIGALYRDLGGEIPRHNRHPFFSEAVNLLGTAVTQAVDGDLSPSQALDEMAQDLRETIDKG